MADSREQLPDYSQYALGRKHGVIQDPRTPMLADFLERRALPKLPHTTNMGSNLHFDMLGNDANGDCGFAAKAHLDHAMSRSKAEPPAQAVLDAYYMFTGEHYGGGDTGVYLLDVLKEWAQLGDVTSEAIEAFVAVNLHDRRLVHAATWIFGGLYIGISLPVTAQRQQLWADTGRVDSDSRPSSWGGHCVYLNASYGVSDQALTCITWGRRQRMTWSFWKRYVDEAYAVIHPDWLARHHGKTPSGFDYPALQSYLAEVR